MIIIRLNRLVMNTLKFGYEIEEYIKWKSYANGVKHCRGFNSKEEALEALEERQKIIIDSDDLFYSNSEIFSYEDSQNNPSSEKRF